MNQVSGSDFILEGRNVRPAKPMTAAVWPTPLHGQIMRDGGLTPTFVRDRDFGSGSRTWRNSGGSGIRWSRVTKRSFILPETGAGEFASPCVEDEGWKALSPWASCGDLPGGVRGVAERGGVVCSRVFGRLVPCAGWGSSEIGRSIGTKQSFILLVVGEDWRCQSLRFSWKDLPEHGNANDSRTLTLLLCSLLLMTMKSLRRI